MIDNICSYTVSFFWSYLFVAGCSWQTRSAGWMLSKVDIIIIS